MRKLLILAAGLLILPMTSQAETLEELLVEKGVITKGEAQAAMHSANAKVYWNEGTRLEFPDTGFTVKFNTQIQARYTYDNKDIEENTSSFDMRRVRIAVSGAALHGEFDYKMQLAFLGDADGDEDGTTSEPDLRDAYLQWNTSDYMSFRVGQFKEAFGRQENASSTSLQFPNRSIANNSFKRSRNQGIRAAFEPTEGFTLGAAVFNGQNTARNQTNPDTRMSAAVDTRVNITGEIDTEVEGDIDRSDEFIMDAGAAYVYGESKAASPVLDDSKLHRVSVDTNMKFKGFFFTAEFFWADQIIDNVSGGRALDAAPLGFHAQAGYFLAEDWELAVRWSMVDCDDGNAGEAGASFKSCKGGEVKDAQEASASLNYFFWKNHLKAQLSYSYFKDKLIVGEDLNDNLIIFQLSAAL